jgi:hypothetical protein
MGGPGSEGPATGAVCNAVIGAVDLTDGVRDGAPGTDPDEGGMTDEAFLRQSYAALAVNDDFTEAVVVMTDGSRLRFRHRVGQRWAKAEAAGLAGEVLALIGTFRLNGKHLDVQLRDGSRWEARFQDSARGTGN